MSDFLGRLLGTAPAPPVRPLLPSRFEPDSRELGPDTGIGAPDTPAAPTGTPASAGSDPGLGEDVSRVEPDRRPVAASPPAVHPLDAADADREAAAPAVHPPAAVAWPAPTAPAATEPGGPGEHRRHRIPQLRAHPVVPLQAEARSPARAEAARPEPSTATSSPSPQALEAALVVADRADGGARRAETGLSAVPSAVPSRGPAPVRPADAGAPRPMAPPRPPARRDRAAAEPTVHISIGRVEVRATAPSATPPARREPPRRQVLGLDDYLRKRAGGERP